MKQKIITVVFFLLEATCSFFAWQSLYRVILVPDVNQLFMPAVFFSLLAVLLLVSTLLFSLVLFRCGMIIIALLPALLFAWSLLSLLCGIIAAGLLYWSIVGIDHELSEHLTVRFFASARMGTFLFSLSFSLIIVAVYATLIMQVPSEKLIPRFSLNEGAGKVVFHIAGKISPSLAKVESDQPSVDEFLIGLMPQDNAEGEGTPSVSVAPLAGVNFQDVVMRDEGRWSQGQSEGNAAELQKRLFLAEGRKRISDMLGREVRGEEKVKDVLPEIINRKMLNVLSISPAEGESVGILRATLSILLFLSLLSLGSVFGVIWATCANFVFWILRGANILAIRRIPVEAEQVVLVD